jgi:hypothetical protein
MSAMDRAAARIAARGHIIVSSSPVLVVDREGSVTIDPREERRTIPGEPDEADRDVLALHAALATERERREAAEARLAALAGAEREASHARIAGAISGAAMVRVRAALDALLSDAPAPAVVPADVVRRYLAALDVVGAGELADDYSDAVRVVDARTALDAALGAT